MKEVLFESNYQNKSVLCLGFFDCVHRGHRDLISAAKKRAEELGAECFVFTFSNNPFAAFGLDEKEIFTYTERKKILEELGISGILCAKMNSEFRELSYVDFLEKLYQSFKIAEVFCGSDYSFGFKGQGKVEQLVQISARFDVKVNVVPFVTEDGNKISSSIIRKCLSQGSVLEANKFLGHPYKICGEVVHNFGRGRVFGFPTANIKLDEDKLYPQEAVYATAVSIDGRLFNSITNVGKKPTFNDFTLTVESFIIGFEGNLYGKYIEVSFFDKIRDIIAFESKEALVDQLKADLEAEKKVARYL
jgi:riboflavin kinase/FMN adenylyltransferase